MKSLYLVDASNMFFRAFFAIPPLTNDKGMPTNALYGYLAMTMKLMREVKPDYICYCFDLKEPSFREGLYPEYKAHRDEMPDNLVPQIPYLKKLTELLGVRHLEKVGFEADDVIGTLAVQAMNHNVQAVIVSGDKDFAQLVRPGISLYDTMKDLRTDVAGVQAKFGVRPDQIIDYLAIVGDSSDNVPGVRGIGPKGAQKLLTDFETLEGVYQNIDKIKGATQKKLIESKDIAFLSRKLVTIVTDVPLDGVTVEDLKLKTIDREPLQALLLELGFKSFERSLFGGGNSSTTASSSPATATPKSATATSGPTGESKSVPNKAPKKSRKAITEWQEEEWTIDDLKKKIEPYSEIWGLLNERGFYLGIDGKVLKVPADEKEIGQVLQHKHLKWKGYDVKQVIKALNIQHQQVIWDGLLAAYVVRAAQVPSFEEVYEANCGQKLPDLASSVDYMKAHLELEACLREQLIQREGMTVYERFELPLVPVLAKMEATGICVDFEELKRQSKTLTDDVRRLEQEIHKAAGEHFNIGSPKQLAHILFEKMKLPPVRKTKTGFSTDSDVLESLIDKHPIAKMLIDYREFTKLKNTYVDALPTMADPVTGRIHTRLNQAATSTGRLSSTNPNLQNIPIRTERGRLVRKAFVASQGQTLISADYSQIELRILAHISQDPGLAKAFKDDLDIHAATAAEVFAVDLSKVTADQRRVAKAVNFGIAYGQGAFGLADTLDIPRQEATEIIQRYFKRFHGVKQYMEDTVRKAIEDGYVSTLFGRRRYIDELQSKNQNIRRAGERAAINAPIQGTASDLVRLAMIKIYESLPIPLLLQVHDELILESPEAEAAAYGRDVQEIMETIYALSVPLKVNVGIGTNWDDAH